jgi:tRNA pseudouridine synthase 10
VTLQGIGSMGVVEKATALLEQYPLCDHCLGRQFSMLGHGLTNGERGTAIKRLLVLEGSRLLLEKDEAGKTLLRQVAVNGFSELSFATLQALGFEVELGETSCYLCGNAFTRLDGLSEKVVERLSSYEFHSFLVGVRAGDRVEDREDELRARFKVRWGESIRSDFSREIGKRVVKATGKEVAFKRPDILVTVNPFTENISLKVNSLFVYGHYRKLVRGIPQAKWVCSQCGGSGCEKCQNTGKLYPESVEELISQPLLQATAGTDVKIHAAGREDIDARVLGSGRPFIIEVVNPVTRSVNLHLLEKEINSTSKGKIEVEQLKFSSKERVRKLKAGEGAEKVYRAKVEFEESISDEALSLLEETMEETMIRQKTPTRVMHRRAEKLRKRRILKLKVKRLNPNLIELLVRCEGGLYIKEFISGDRGRTSLSVSEVTSTPARCVELDVLKVYVEESN